MSIKQTFEQIINTINILIYDTIIYTRREVKKPKVKKLSVQEIISKVKK